jgi:hypothetical protein
MADKARKEQTMPEHSDMDAETEPKIEPTAYANIAPS